jgi:hypothetical protein
MSGDMICNRIKSQNKGALGVFGNVMPTLLESNLKIATTRANVVELRAMKQTASTLGLYCRADGFDPTRSFQHVANVDNEIWQVILGMFARYDEETGEFMDDGLLYKYDTTVGCVKLYKPFFYAIIDFLEASGYACDMRGKIKLT